MPRSRNNFDLNQAASLGLTLAAALSLFAYLGYRIDLWLESSPIGLIAGCLLGMAGGMTHVIRKVGQLQSRAKAAPPDERDRTDDRRPGERNDPEQRDGPEQRSDDVGR